VFVVFNNRNTEKTNTTLLFQKSRMSIIYNS